MRAPHTRRSNEIAEHALPDFVPSHLAAEWTAISCGRHNVLLAGAPSALDALLASITPNLEEPIRMFDAATGTVLPTKGTLVLTEIGDLNAEQQLRLLAWMDGAGREGHVQIVSTTSRPIVPLMERGAFRAELYYRLNVVRIDLDEP
jgi:sigma-54-interacting transcriptional regulator